MLARISHLILLIVLIWATPLTGPGVPAHLAWFCPLVGDWKAVMRRDHPDADRSLPEIEATCRLAE